ncbi:MAG: hypothetical protein GWN71_14865, partial [Gammaproteobacteria bacterium]|nr:hypothetical protein [Gammaproteobacteria bacterium]
LADWPWTQIVGGGMVVISGLMLSHAIYPAVPRINLRTTDGRVGLAVIVAVTAALIWSPRLVLFPAGIAYVGYGALKAVILGLLDRLPE